ncbi:MFS transporter [Streptomyces sp. P38-E01]|uniref:MFS transporter n=1 Tax=Streptomyces tardus TaxID=2780544 RepID=A0A949JN91_9ACTN|nr:MFS transporter [Streptomyces tardus]MBU7598231.1 MFS transporter [Streptomyces tardus]
MTDTKITKGPGSGPESSPVHRAGKREWIGLFVLALPTLLISLDMTVLHLAVPQLSADLSPSSTQLLWIVDIYGFLIAGSLITMGTLGDRIGRRRLLMLGAAGFGAASVLAAFAGSAGELIAARALLGLAGATLMPSTMSLIRNMFHEPRQRTVAISVWMSSFMLGAGAGPLVGGAMLEHFWWGSVFLLGVPVMVLLLVAGPILLPEFKDPGRGRIDLLSAVLSLATVLSFVYGIKKTAENGPSAPTLAAMALGIGIGVFFVRRQRHQAEPFVDFGLFRNRGFAVSIGAVGLAVFASGGLMFFIGQYLQMVLDLSPFKAGLYGLPGVLAGMVTIMLAPMLLQWFRAAYVMAAGLLVSVVGIVMLARITVDSESWVVITALVVMHLGFGPTMALGTDLIIAGAPPERAGTASALSETSTEMGMALGIAVIGSAGTAVYRREMEETTPQDLPHEMARVAGDTIGGANAMAAQLPERLGSPLMEAAGRAFVSGMALTALVSAVMITGIAVMVALLLRNHKPAEGGHGAEPAASGGPAVDGDAADGAAVAVGAAEQRDGVALVKEVRPPSSREFDEAPL